MSLLFLKAYWNLMLFDWYVARRDFAGLYNRVRKCPVHTGKSTPDALQIICHAIDIACIWYRKEVLCLQRSAATTCLLKQYGVAAQMVIGAHQLPFKAHAWVEVGGSVANDKPYTPEMYVVLDRC